LANTLQIVGNNQKNASIISYKYAAIPEILVQTKGRSHAGGNVTTYYNDSTRIGITQLTADASAMRRYIPYYEYDEVGNKLQMKHTNTSGTGNWLPR
jgi:hypothetical protein